MSTEKYDISTAVVCSVKPSTNLNSELVTIKYTILHLVIFICQHSNLKICSDSSAPNIGKSFHSFALFKSSITTFLKIPLHLTPHSGFALFCLDFINRIFSNKDTSHYLLTKIKYEFSREF